MSKFLKIFGSLLLIVALASCSQNDNPAGVDTDDINTKRARFTTPNPEDALQSTLTEGFESGTKTSYAGASVTLGSGSWYMDDALIGNLAEDRKTGARAARIRGFGRVTMLFDRTTGAGAVTIQHARYGSDGNSTWELWMSTNGGSTWSRVGGSVSATSTSLQTATFTVNVSGTVRFEIRKTDGTSNRLNIDEITITSFSSAPPPSGSVHLTMGNPTNAITSTSFPSNYLIQRAQYALSYHRDKGIPNWVSWHLDASWLGSTPRQDDFRADNALPSGWYRVSQTSYSGSGFDRGHNCPSADRTRTVADNSATFFMTNMIPQAPDNNQGPWVRLEDYCRKLVSQGNELYIIMGQYGTGGTGSNGYRASIDNGRVHVPSRVWKVIIVLPNGTNDVARVTTSTRVIAVDMPNAQGIRSHNWGSYRTTVDAIEQAAGVDVLSAVPASIQAVIESRVDNGPTQ